MMPVRKKDIPKKLKHDAIVEAILEIRFQTTTIPEMLFGRLADYQPWKDFSHSRLPAQDIPRAIREGDPYLKLQPLFALSNSQCTVRIGPNAISFHRAAPYEGWSVFHPQIEEMITGLFQKADNLTVNRLGLRYLNSLQSDLHGIASILNLDLKMSVEDQSISGNVNLNFASDVADKTACTVRIATPEFVQGLSLQRPQASVYIDVDVFTKEPFEKRAEQDVQAWVTTAHTIEKDQFFRLLTEEKIKELRED
jgi:uncharacterized protein (TIGR04255 family)